MNYCTVRAFLKCEPQLWNSSRDLRRGLWQTNEWYVCVCVFERVSLWFCSCLYQVFSGLNFTSAICSFFHSIQNSVYVKTKPQKFTGGDPFLNRLKTYIVFCRVPVMCAAKTIQLKALTRPNSHSVLPFGAIPSGFPSPVTVAKVCSVPLLNIYNAIGDCYWGGCRSKEYITHHILV